MSIRQLLEDKNFPRNTRMTGRVVCQLSKFAVPFFDWLPPPLRLPSGASDLEIFILWSESKAIGFASSMK